jgi:hypothetical protein
MFLTFHSSFKIIIFKPHLPNLNLNFGYNLDIANRLQ